MLRLGIVMLATVFSAGQAMAFCYDTLGCDDTDRFSKSYLRRLSCNALFEVRNGIYFQEGLCFQTDRALEMFGDAGCFVDDPADVELSRIERYNVSQVAAVERQKGC